MKKWILICLGLVWMSSSWAWERKPAATRTLPIVYVNTDNRRAVTDTETQIPASLYIDSVLAKYKSLGSSAAPIRCTIKGRGNWTWSGFDKKPYKIKFDVKQKVLGMPNNRHWCLQAAADDWLGFLKNPAGHMISEALGLRWTPRMVPVELMLNGQYMGLYFMTEHVRIASNRVKIKEQADQETHADSISGGWLVEIDNYRTENNIEFNEGNGQFVMVSLREPEELSRVQRQYLEAQIGALNEALYAPSSTQLEQLLDIREAAKYYLVQEIMEDCESYHGSCFLYKDRDSLGVADKWKFGPVWDFGNAYNRQQERWIYDGPTWPQYWIGQLATWPVFQQAVKEEWWRFYHGMKDEVADKVSSLASTITTAAKKDAEVWNGTQNYCNNSDMRQKKDDFMRIYNWRIQWLYSQWGEGIQPSTDLPDKPFEPAGVRKTLRNGQLIIEQNGRQYTILGSPIR